MWLPPASGLLRGGLFAPATTEKGGDGDTGELGAIGIDILLRCAAREGVPRCGVS